MNAKNNYNDDENIIEDIDPAGEYENVNGDKDDTKS